MLHSNSTSNKNSNILSENSFFTLKTNSEIKIQISSSITPIKAIWDQAASNENLFLQTDYLEMLEKFPPEKMSFRYIIFFEGKTPIGVSYHQIFKLKVEDSINKEEATKEEEKKGYCLINAISGAIKKWFIKRADFNLLISGNLLLTGEYGFYFDTKYDKAKTACLLQESMDVLQNILDKNKEKITIQLIKDHYKEEAVTLEDTLKSRNYHSFLMQPCMKMEVRPSWTDFDTYLSDMSSKYRVRAKRAKKKGAKIVKKELSLAEIEENESRIHSLYKEIADGAGFNAFLLHPSYFTELKRALGDNYKLTAYYIDNKLIAFYTAIFNYGEMDAHFLGVDGSYNREHQVYLNILYDLVNTGIENQCTGLDFARTALEIKSSIGAVAHDMVCFIRHRNTISTKFLNLMFDSINPEEKWQPRSPFKKALVAN